ncbi:RNA 2',3'-cyclic phosphodiesterase [Dactylosporangium sp. CA-139066]|uniref:RNA 2',3'-cyclic phosphodiesterase n=1 Tax=Dactylosporangium sp. CA-139066 TaxID=3239930 RepID=UPI003D93A98B
MAAYPPAEVREHFKSMVDSLAVARPRERSVRLHSGERWHLTVAFIGDVEEPDAAVEALGELRGTHGPTVRIAGGKTLGRGRFRHLVAQLESDDLEPLGTAVRQALKRHRLPYDRRPWQPHVTIARPGDLLSREELDGDLATLAAYRGPLWRVDEVRLMRSHLGPKPEYDQLAAVTLDGTAAGR